MHWLVRVHQASALAFLGAGCCCPSTLCFRCNSRSSCSFFSVAICRQGDHLLSLFCTAEEYQAQHLVTVHSRPSGHCFTMMAVQSRAKHSAASAA